MKFYFLILSAFILCVSCTSDDQNTTSPVTGKRIKKIKETHYNGSPSPEFVHESAYYYQNNVLINTISGTPGSGNTFNAEYHYNGNKITEIVYFENDATEPSGMSSFTYDGNFLRYINNNIIHQRREFLYNGGRLTRQNIYFASVNETNPTNLGEQYNYTFNQENVSQQTYESYAGLVFQYTTDYQYDLKNNPMIGMNPYLRLMYSAQGFHPLATHNITASTDTYWGSGTPIEYVYDIVYDDDNYPVKIIKSYQESQAVILVLEFEYL